MRLFKNFKAKKQLREEIERLQCRLPVINVERMDIKELRASTIITDKNLVDDDCAKLYAKRAIWDKMRDDMIPFIEYSEEVIPDGKIIRGKLRVVEKRI